MSRLSRRIALLLVAAIVTVVALASLAAAIAFRPPPPDTTMEPVARQIHLLAGFAEADRGAALAAGTRISPAPVSGRPDPGLSGYLQRALERTGNHREAHVVQIGPRGFLTASVRLAGGDYIVTQIPDFRLPRSNLLVLIGWIALIAIGSTVVALFAARMITRPLGVIEQAVASIGPDGVPPPIPEIGPAEARAAAQALNRMSRRLKQAMESRMRLVAAAGHDLRTPMTRMRLRAEFLPEEERERWLADLDELDMIADSAIRLVREEASAEQGQVVDLHRLLTAIVRELAAQGHAVRFAGDRGVMVAAGPLALTRALRNLLINAATHGRKAEAALRATASGAVLTIADQGPGIPEDQLERVFEPFFRVDLARRKSLPGAGLGLAIAREIVERFGGSIRIENRSQGGLLQTVTFPPPAAA